MEEKEKIGYIYIMTNPAFSELVKIGYSNDPMRRLKDLSNSSSVPYAFRLRATYAVNTENVDIELHKLITLLNPGLRVREEVDDSTKQRKREFFKMSVDDVYELLDKIATISNTKDRLKYFPLDEEGLADEKEVKRTRAENFSLSKCGIEIGAKLVLKDHLDVIATVIDDRYIEYNGEVGSLSGFARNILGMASAAGASFWIYQGEKPEYQGKTVDNIRKEREEEGSYQ